MPSRYQNIPKVLPKYGEVALRRQAQEYFTMFSDEEAEERRRLESLYLSAYNQTFLQEAFDAEVIEQILNEERTNPTKVFTVQADRAEPFTVTAIPE